MTRNCPSCNKELHFNSPQSFYRAKKNNSLCRSCAATISNSKKEKTEYVRIRNCPSCNKQLIYTSRAVFCTAKKRNSLCGTCAKRKPIHLHKKSKNYSPAWSKKIKEIYNNQCSVCYSTDNLHAHHILPRVAFPELSLSLNNGICLCKNCHDEFHSLNGKVQMGRSL